MIGDDHFEFGLMDLQQATQGIDLVLSHILLPTAYDHLRGERCGATEIKAEIFGNGMSIMSGSCGGEDQQIASRSIGLDESGHDRIDTRQHLLHELIKAALAVDESGRLAQQGMLHPAVADYPQFAQSDPPEDTQTDAQSETMESDIATITEIVAESVGSDKRTIKIDGYGFAQFIFDNHWTKGNDKVCDCDRGRSRRHR